ncbi:carbohydrate kinase family protein [Amycolatopsis sp. FDAARGOS 1241]|uniref:carbohydrate kinase family protein n=1 Tax=Amycolatopsis sp. FDAARGOS 1241 TaxID=2778070 RepID=UPI00194FCE38|nr:PfkB family carbohydrate kinase [Amycolatopsis sp. FDAARGOS 1241]QRP44857.1 ribokinase [Amycolatopsis sp. FDAARGOS 1241]
MATVDGILGAFLGLRKRSGLTVERLGSTEVDVSRLVALPAVQAVVSGGTPVEEAIVRVVADAVRRLPPTDRIVADAVLALGVLGEHAGDAPELAGLYADDLGERRSALSRNWVRLHALLDAVPAPPVMSVRSLRGSQEAQTLARLAELCAGAPQAAPARLSRPRPEGAKSVVVVGGAVMDHVWVVDSVPGPGRSTQATSFRRHPGGKGLNLAVALHRQELDSRLIAAVGGDDLARAIVSYLDEEGLPTDLVQETPGAKTPTTAVLVTQSGDASYVGWMNDTQVGLSIADLHSRPIRDALAGADALLVTFEPAVEVVKWSLATAGAQRHKPLVLLQPSPPISAPQGVYRYLGGVDYVVGREWELRRLLSDPDGPSDVDAVAQQLLNLGVHAVCVVEDFRCRLRTVTLSRDIEAPDVPLNDTPASRERFSAALIRKLLDVGRDFTENALDYAVAAMTTNPSIEEFTDSAPAIFEVDRVRERQSLE